MSVKLRLARIATVLERWVDRLSRRKAAQTRVIDPYIGYATPDHLVVRGRVLTRSTAKTARDGQSRWANLRQMLGLFLTDEVADVTVSHDATKVRTDEEGYFTLQLPRTDEGGLVEIDVSVGDTRALCPVCIPDPTAEFGVISDIDDTMMETGAYSLWRNLVTSLTGNVLTRRIFPDAVQLMNILTSDGRNPVYFVSSSPWNLHGFLAEIFARNGLPLGPKFLRDYGISETQFITGTHGDHKGGSIDTILQANPDLAFVLIGDTGQHDAHVYRDAVRRHPGRINRVILRAPGAGADADDLAYVEQIKAVGVPVHVGADYRDAIASLSDTSVASVA